MNAEARLRFRNNESAERVHIIIGVQPSVIIGDLMVCPFLSYKLNTGWLLNFGQRTSFCWTTWRSFSMLFDYMKL